METRISLPDPFVASYEMTLTTGEPHCMSDWMDRIPLRRRDAEKKGLGSLRPRPHLRIHLRVLGSFPDWASRFAASREESFSAGALGQSSRVDFVFLRRSVRALLGVGLPPLCPFRKPTEAV